MNTIYESTYLRVTHQPDKQFFYFTFNEKTLDMTPEEYIQNLEDFIKLIRQYQPKRILGDMVRFQFIITPDIQEWIDKNLFTVYAEIGFEKIAILLSIEFVSKLSIQQTMEEDSTQAFKTQYYDNDEDAMAWLFADYVAEEAQSSVVMKK